MAIPATYYRHAEAVLTLRHRGRQAAFHSRTRVLPLQSHFIPDVKLRGRGYLRSRCRPRARPLGVVSPATDRDTDFPGLHAGTGCGGVALCAEDRWARISVGHRLRY